MTSLLKKARNDSVAIFNAGCRAVAPKEAINRYCRRQGNLLTIGSETYHLDSYERVYIIGAGKATAPMAQAFESLLGDNLHAGFISVKYDHTVPLSKVCVVEAAHPVPDKNGEYGSEKILEIARMATEKDLCICLLSGGGSALLPLSVAGVSLADKQETTRVLLACGATIHEVNTMRKHLSQIKGGQLAVAAYPATLVSLILSDVVGDDLDVIASGPTVPDRTTFSDCEEIIKKYDIGEKLPESVVNHFIKGKQAAELETPKADNTVFKKTRNVIIGSNIEALQAARKEAEKRGYQTIILSSMIEGETADIARVHTAIAKEVAVSGNPLAPPACILSGGETTVTLRGTGKGGRNQHFALCAAPDIAGEQRIVMLSGGTDGNDGPTDAAGAFADNTTLERAENDRLDYKVYLADNDSYHFFQKLDDLLITGPTNTNVMDLRIILVPDP
ncbi:MAG: glycerate kinase [Desulfobulbaceae bacterium]|nr:MAG: glycerate kinase [Desulfobulbaceae bacterium]